MVIYELSPVIFPLHTPLQLASAESVMRNSCHMRVICDEVFLRLLASNRGSRRKCVVTPSRPLSRDWPPAKHRLFGRGSRGGRRHLNSARMSNC